MFDFLIAMSQAGFKTKYHCIGHTEDEFSYVMLDECVADDDICKIIKLFSRGGEFEVSGITVNKFARLLRGVIKMNWIINLVNNKKYETETTAKRAKKIELYYKHFK